MQSFHEVRFPEDVSFGATGGPERRNEIVALTSGREKRNLRFAQSRRRFDAGTGVRSLADLYEIVAFFEARRGSLHGFRFRDPFDMKSCPPDAQPSAFDQFIDFAGRAVEDSDFVTATFDVEGQVLAHHRQTDQTEIAVTAHVFHRYQIDTKGLTSAPS